MRTRALLTAAALALAAPSPASAGVAPTVARGSCWVEVTNGSARCVVQLAANPNGAFYLSTWSGYATADLECHVSGRRFHLQGGYGFRLLPWSHGADVCDLTLQVSDGHAGAGID